MFVKITNLCCSNGYLLVANQGENTVVAVDPDNLNILEKNLCEGINLPVTIKVSPDLKYAYVANQGNNTISVIDLQNHNTVIETITEDINCPCSIEISPNGKFIYVASFGNDSINIIDVENNFQTKFRAVEGIERPYSIAADPDGNYLYVSNLGDNSIAVLSINKDFALVGKVTKDIDLPYSVVVSPNSEFAYVANGGSNQITVIDLNNSFQTKVLEVHEINSPYALAVTPDGNDLYVANYSGSLVILDLQKNCEIKELITENITAPYSIELSRYPHYAYVANLGDSSVSEINLKTMKSRKLESENISKPHAVAFCNLQYPPKPKSFGNVDFCYLSDADSIVDEKAQMISYLTKFPEEQYSRYFSSDTGSFLIDSVNDPIKNELRKGNIWEPHVHELVKKYSKPGTTVLDIGAHIGTETVLMGNCVGPLGKVYTFEPQKKNYRELWANCILNNLQDRVCLYHMAIGNKHKVVEIGEIVESSDGEVDEGGIGVWGGGETVEMRTIDSFNLNNVSLIKIDVEGGENSVIAGMVETVKRNQPVIVIEIQGGWTRDMAPPAIRTAILETQALLENLDYTVQHITAWDYVAFPKGF